MESITRTWLEKDYLLQESMLLQRVCFCREYAIAESMLLQRVCYCREYDFAISSMCIKTNTYDLKGVAAP
jgi:hypothetical protein